MTTAVSEDHSPQAGKQSSGGCLVLALCAFPCMAAMDLQMLPHLLAGAALALGLTPLYARRLWAKGITWLLVLLANAAIYQPYDVSLAVGDTVAVRQAAIVYLPSRQKELEKQGLREDWDFIRRRVACAGPLPKRALLFVVPRL